MVFSSKHCLETHENQPDDPERQWLHLPHGPFAYTDEGTGPVVLAIHGCPGSVRDWRWLGHPLASYFRLIRLDLPGFGETPLATAPGASMEARGDALIQIMDALNIDECILIAHSAGGVVAMEVAAHQHHRVKALALIAVPGARPHRAIRKSILMRIGYREDCGYRTNMD